MITVRLVIKNRLWHWLKRLLTKAKILISPIRLISYAGRICYSEKIPNIAKEKMLDVEGQLFKPGHFTTFEHENFSFAIDGLPISDFTFHLHALAPYYNSDQRSGRFTKKMFNNPNFEEIREHITSFYNPSNIDDIMDYIKFSHSIFSSNFIQSQEISKRFLEERVKDEKYVKSNFEKMAQEQLRNCISTIFPTGAIYSIDLASLVALYETVSNPVMKRVVDLMKNEFLKEYPEAKFVFNDINNANNGQQESIELVGETSFIYSPSCKLLSFSNNGLKIIIPEISDVMPVDKLSYKRKYQGNSIMSISSEVSMSVATFGQDQRHRTIKRSKPEFTGEFYINPIIKELNIEKDIQKLMDWWISFYSTIPANLFEELAPYGAVVKYVKTCDVNAKIHEQAKRLCWCAQEEIFNLNRLEREQIRLFGNKELLKIYNPPCMYENGKCHEGTRFCRRQEKNPENPCPLRKI